MTVTIILISIICVFIWYYILNYRQSSNKKTNVLPGPKTLPLIGTAYYLLQQNPDGNSKKICLIYRNKKN